MLSKVLWAAALLENKIFDWVKNPCEKDYPSIAKSSDLKFE